MNSSSFCGKLQDDLGAIPTSFFVETTRALAFEAMEILDHDDIVKVIEVTCFLFSNSNMKKQNKTNKQNCANEFARDSRQWLSTDFSTVLQFETYLVR